MNLDLKVGDLIEIHFNHGLTNIVVRTIISIKGFKYNLDNEDYLIWLDSDICNRDFLYYLDHNGQLPSSKDSGLLI